MQARAVTPKTNLRGGNWFSKRDMVDEDEERSDDDDDDGGDVNGVRVEVLAVLHCRGLWGCSRESFTEVGSMLRYRFQRGSVSFLCTAGGAFGKMGTSWGWAGANM